MARAKRASVESAAALPFEGQLFAAASKLRSNLDAAEYKHVVLGLVFLKYASGVAAHGAAPGAGALSVPEGASWKAIQDAAMAGSPGRQIDQAIRLIEEANPGLTGTFPAGYARPALDQRRLSELVLLIDQLEFHGESHESKDLLGRVYEYFLSEFAKAEGKKGGQFYTPRCVVSLLVEMLAPVGGVVYDPCCGSAGMFVQSDRFVSAEGGDSSRLRFVGQESNQTTWRLARMNAVLRGLDATFGDRHADSFHDDLHPGLKADYIISNPPFNDSDWGGDLLDADPRWRYGVPRSGNANFAWIQHYISKLSDRGYAAFVMANGSLSLTQSDAEIRRAIVDADLVDCVVTLPSNLFYSTTVPVCIWVLARSKSLKRQRARKGQLLLVDARGFGRMVDRIHRELTDSEVNRIASTYRNWRGDGSEKYVDVPGFCRSVTVGDVAKHDYALVPGRYVGFASRPGDKWDPAELRRELDEIETRLSSVGASASTALDILREVIGG